MVVNSVVGLGSRILPPGLLKFSLTFLIESPSNSIRSFRDHPSHAVTEPSFNDTHRYEHHSQIMLRLELLPISWVFLKCNDFTTRTIWHNELFNIINVTSSASVTLL